MTDFKGLAPDVNMPGVRDGLVDGEPVLGVDGEHLADEVLGLLADRPPPRAAQVKPAGAHGLVEAVLGAQDSPYMS